MLDSKGSFTVDNGSFSFAASKDAFKLADFKIDGELISLVTELEDDLKINLDESVRWRMSAPLHDDHTLIYNESSKKPNLKFTRSIYVDREKSQVKIRYNLKNRNSDKAIRFSWALRAKMNQKLEVTKQDKVLSLLDAKSTLVFKSDKKISSEIKGGLVEISLNESAQFQVLQPLNRLSWQVILDIQSMEKSSWWQIF